MPMPMTPLIQIRQGVARHPLYRLRAPFDFTLHAGEHTVLFGKNGAGKTLLARQIAGACPLLGEARTDNLASEQHTQGGIRCLSFRDIYGGNEPAYYQQRWNRADEQVFPTVAEMLERAKPVGEEVSEETLRRVEETGITAHLDKTINLLRDRVDVAPMVVAEIDANFDPNRDRGTAAWTRGYDAKTNYEVDPVLWEIRRERMVELMGQGFSFYDVKRWHKAPYYTNRQPCGAWVTATDLPYGTGKYTGQFVDYNEIQQTGSATPQNNDAGSGWIYTKHGPLTVGSGWNDTFYLEMVPQDQINLNPALVQNPGYNELFGLN